MSPTSVSCASCAAPLSVGSVKCDYCGVQIGGVALPRTDEPGWASPFAQTPGTSGASVDAVYTPAQRGPVDLAKFWPAVNRCFYKYSIFTGRASLAEYWWWTVFTFVATIVLGGMSHSRNPLPGIFQVAAFVPTMAVTLRRLHDVRESGMSYLWILTIVGGFYVLYLLCKPSDRGPNMYGAPDPI